MATQTVGSSGAKSQTFFERYFARHAWKVLLGISIIIAFFGVLDMVGGASDLQNGERVLMQSLTGMSWSELQEASPAAAHLVDWKFRSGGASLFVMAVLSMAVCLTGFRRRERWAWYTQWSMPVWIALTVLTTLMAVTYPEYGTPVPVISGSILFVLWVATLGLSYRTFFRIQPVRGSD